MFWLCLALLATGIQVFFAVAESMSTAQLGKTQTPLFPSRIPGAAAWAAVSAQRAAYPPDGARGA